MDILSLWDRDREDLFEEARRIRDRIYGPKVYLRALIECTSYCRKDCMYCGLRRSSRSAVRYRLSESDILKAAGRAYAEGLRTFVLQGGEDPIFVKGIPSLVSALRDSFPDAAITLSFGEWPELYGQWDADRYLLRHETADAGHYAMLHPDSVLSDRIACLRLLRKLGFQTGAGFMVGSPYQTKEHIMKDLAFIEDLQPEMVGIGPFIPHHDTPFRDMKAGSADETIFLIAMLRHIVPRALIPATTALASISEDGTERALLAGANVIMPNFTPAEGYGIYDGKKKQAIDDSLIRSVERAGCSISLDRGDFADAEGF